MRRPLSTPISRGSLERAGATGDVGRLVVADAPDEAVPEHLEQRLPRARSAAWWCLPLASWDDASEFGRHLILQLEDGSRPDLKSPSSICDESKVG